MSMTRFIDRLDAGRRLADALREQVEPDAIVLGLPRGGVPVAAEVARALRAPLDIILVRKLGVPSQPELAMGAIGEGGIRVLNRDLIRVARVSEDDITRVEASERQELERRSVRYRGDRPMTPIAGRTAVIVDDGIATGATMTAACQVARQHGARRIVVAAPVAAPSVVRDLAHVADAVVVVAQPADLDGVGRWYDDFHPTTDDVVVASLAASRVGSSVVGPTVMQEIDLRVAAAHLAGDLVVPAAAGGLVVFAHGSGSSRHSPRNRAVAQLLQAAGLATLLFDLLTETEAADRRNVFDADLLGSRLAEVTRIANRDPRLAPLPVGYFGASTGAAAALWAAAEQDLSIGAIVSRGGRPDLAGRRLSAVQAPTLLIVGDRDRDVIELNRRAMRSLQAPHRLVLVPGATHLFDEPGTLARAAELARDWFVAHLVAHRDPVAASRSRP